MEDWRIRKALENQRKSGITPPPRTAVPATPAEPPSRDLQVVTSGEFLDEKDGEASQEVTLGLNVPHGYGLV